MNENTVEFTSMNEAQDFMNAIMANPAIVIAASGSASSRNSGGGVGQTIYAAFFFPPMRLTKAHLSDGNKRIAIMLALTLLGMKRFVLDGHDLTEAEDKAVCLLIEFIVCKDTATGGSGPLPRE